MQKDIIYQKRQYFGQVNKLQYSNKTSKNNLEKSKPVVTYTKENVEKNSISDEIIKRENTIISILINTPESFQRIKQKMKIEDFKYDLNRKIIQALYEELKKEDGNINAVLDRFQEEEIQSHLTAIMAEDYGITDNNKAIEDILKKYEREKLEKRRNELLKETSIEQDPSKKRKLGEELNDIMLKLIKIK